MAKRILIRAAKTIGVLAVTALACGMILLASLLVDHTRSITLPTPSGACMVGRTIYTWTDDSRSNPYASTAATKEELAVWIWYPAAPTSANQPSDYLPAYWRRALERHQGFVIGTLFSHDLSRVHSHSWADADVSPRDATYPVVILRAGGGALSSDYTSIAEDLASHGYVVVSFDAPYRTVITAFPDGRVMTRTARSDVENLVGQDAERLATSLMNAWVADVKFVLDKLQQLNAEDPTGRFKGRLNMADIGIAGHSLGGATALQFCHDDMRCKAGIDIDGMPFGSVIAEGIHRPFFFIMSDHRKETGPEANVVRNHIESIYSSLPEGQRWGVMIVGAKHFSFSDQMLTKSSIFLTGLRTIGVLGPLEKRRGLAIASACVDAFFDVYLKGARASQLEGLPAVYPEVKSGVADAFPPD